ncbi:MAG TPA: oxygenase MpaB family protein [Acidimicrobiales bacterium]|jgi:uncharacterized protein (DUF2236 family)
MTAVLRAVGDRVAASLRGTLSGSATGVPEWVAALAEPGDAGWSGPGSASWAVHGSLATLIGGIRALALQALHPLVLAGVDQHSSYRTDPLSRLWNTNRFITITTFGSSAQAAAEVEMVRAIHRRVVGVAADGRPYRADDPHLLGWVHLTLTHSMWWAFEHFHDDLDLGADADAYFAETAQVGAALGVTDPARTAAEASDQLDAYLPELTRDDITERTLHFIERPPLSGLTAVGYRPLAAAAWWGLPAAVRPLAGPGPLVPFPEQAARLELAGLRAALRRSPAQANAYGRAAPEEDEQAG